MSQTGPSEADKTGASGNGRMALGLLAVAAVMVGLSFAAVPLYRIFCAKNRLGRNASTRCVRSQDHRTGNGDGPL